jgi:hypothetical protein
MAECGREDALSTDTSWALISELYEVPDTLDLDPHCNVAFPVRMTQRQVKAGKNDSL